MKSEPKDEPHTTKIDDKFDIEARSYEIAGAMNPEDEQERQFFFRHLRTGMNEAWEAGRRSMTFRNRIRHYIAHKRLGL